MSRTGYDCFLTQMIIIVVKRLLVTGLLASYLIAAASGTEQCTGWVPRTRSSSAHSKAESFLKSPLASRETAKPNLPLVGRIAHFAMTLKKPGRNRNPARKDLHDPRLPSPSEEFRSQPVSVLAVVTCLSHTTG